MRTELQAPVQGLKASTQTNKTRCFFSRHEAGDQYSLFARPFITISLYSLVASINDKFFGVCLPII